MPNDIALQVEGLTEVATLLREAAEHCPHLLDSDSMANMTPEQARGHARAMWAPLTALIGLHAALRARGKG